MPHFESLGVSFSVIKFRPNSFFYDHIKIVSNSKTLQRVTNNALIEKDRSADNEDGIRRKTVVMNTV